MIGLTNAAGATQDFPTEEKRRRHHPKSNLLAACAFALCGQTLSVRDVPVHERHRPLPLCPLSPVQSGVPIHAGGRPQRALPRACLLPSSSATSARLATTGLTAVQGVDDVLRIKRGESVAIHGASGAVGSLALQFAKMQN